MISVATAAALLWLGMVLAISFLEAPLKFRAPGIDLPTGLAIGRIVFRALNRVEMVWAVIIAATLIVDPPPLTPLIAGIAALALLIVQLGVVRPALGRRSNQILAGSNAPRSSPHHVYVAFEAAKVIALIILSASLMRN